jgi:(1->4)-alpha-D-glucan 1-alpha-D-glucosylmutase
VSTDAPKRPAPPASTYRLQINGEFGFDDAARQCAYLAALGVTHLYLSPILQAAPGSPHGYDVVDHTRLSADAGGRAAFDRLVRAAHEHSLKLIADVVPNHMAVPVPERLNAPLWSVLKAGPGSPFACWFDIDWSPGQVLMPVLGDPIGQVIADGLLTVDDKGDEPVLRYYEHEFPLREGTAGLPLPDLLAQQHYRLAWWRIGSDDLNYRRFFDVTTLAAIRVEDPAVFAATHDLLTGLVRDGSLDGLRIDHPDGLADPRGYLRDLATATGGTWVVAEKILEGDEALPSDWPCAGTTGYDALNVVGGLFVDPQARDALTEAAGGTHLDDAVLAAKRLVIDDVLAAELTRLTSLLVRICAQAPSLRDTSRRALHCALAALLAAMDRYRAYAVPGEPVPAESAAVIAAAAGRALPLLGSETERAALDAVAALALDTLSGDPLRDEFVVRFQQTCGPVMAKGIEDTLFYRWTALLALNEVGADPHRFGYSPNEFHAYANSRLHTWPSTMTTLSTHDTKRSEDARARLYALSEVPQEWISAVRDWQPVAHRDGAAGLDAGATALFWQSVIAIWDDGPPNLERLTGYLVKALREAKQSTTWTAPDDAFEQAVHDLARRTLADLGLVASIGSFVDGLAPADRANILGQKLIQLTMPGVPDVYQGCELVQRSLVDPDNRRPVDYGRRSALLAATAPRRPPAASRMPASADTRDAEKLLVTASALGLRRDHPEWFGPGSGYAPISTTSPHAVAFSRGTPERAEVITVVTRLALQLAAAAGWADHTVHLPAGRWTDRLTGETLDGGPVSLAQLLASYPVALLTREASEH